MENKDRKTSVVGVSRVILYKHVSMVLVKFVTSISKAGYYRLGYAGFSVRLYLPSAKFLKVNQKKLFFRI